MRQQKKYSIEKTQDSRFQLTKQLLLQQDNQIKLKNLKIQNQIALLNLQIDYLLKQIKFKEYSQKTLLKERKKLQTCFLLKKIQENGIKNNLTENSQTDLLKNKAKNQFRDVNQRIKQFIEILQSQKENQDFNQLKQTNAQAQNLNQQSNRKLQCQSLHLREIFNPQQTVIHLKNTSQLQQKLSLLYEKIHLNLECEQPYLYEKIIQRIKRQAQSYTRKKLIQEIDKLIKQNSVWTTQEINRVNNKLQQQKVEQICVNNLGLMKKIMAKKVANNDWIFENYQEQKFMSKSNQVFPIQKITSSYRQVIKQMEQSRISDQLKMVRKNKSSDGDKTSPSSLKQIISDDMVQNIFLQSKKLPDQLQESEISLFKKVEQIQNQIESLLKGGYVK